MLVKTDTFSYQIKPTSKLKFRQLRFSSTPDIYNLYVVTRWDTDDSVKVPLSHVSTVHLLSLGNTVQQCADVMNMKINDVYDIVNTLVSCGFVYQIDKDILPDESKPIHPLWNHLKARWFRWILSPLFIIPSFLFILCGAFIGIFTIGYFPTFENFFWSKDIFVDYVSIFLIDTILVFNHEFAHYMATRAIGGEATMGMNVRFTDLVAETTSFHISLLPKYMRYFVYFAGIYNDLMYIAGCYILFFIADLNHWNLGIIRNLLIVGILVSMRAIVWQFNVYLKTDMYNFLSDVLDQDSLRENAIKHVRDKISLWKTHNPFFVFCKKNLLKMFLKKRQVSAADDLRTLKENDRTEMRIYSVLLIGGIIFSLIQFVTYSIPKDITFIVAGLQLAVAAIAHQNWIEFIKSIIVVCLSLFMNIYLYYLIWKNARS